METLTENDYEKFNQFIFYISDSIEELDSLASKNGIQLNFSSEFPSNIEKLIIKLDIDLSDSILINKVAQYVGEYFRKAIGGKWILGNDPIDDSVHFNLPVIGHFNDIGYVFSPIGIVRGFLNRKKEGLIVRAIERHREQLS